MAAQLILDIVTDSSKAVSGFKKVDQAAAETAQKTQSSGSKIAGYAKAVAGAFAVAKVVAFGKESVNAAEEAAVSNARLVSVFKGAGDASGEAAKHAAEFADSLGKHTGIDPEVIKGGEAILATFHSVSDETGRSAGIFDRATQAAADLAAAGFGDLKSNSVQLGKALEDPVKGMSALSRSGVTFTQAQQAQIKALEATHQHLAAQKIVLGAVEGQVKGTAAATATAGAKMSVAFKEAQVTIGTALLPYIDKIKQVLVDVFTFVSNNSSWLLPLVMGIAAAVGVIKTITMATKLWGDAMKIAKGIQQAWSAITKGATAVQAAFNAVMDANPIALIIIAIVLLIAGIVLLVTHVKAVREVMLEVWKTVASAAQTAFHFILAIIQGVWNWLKSNWPLVLTILLGPIGAAAALIIKHWTDIKNGVVGIYNWLRSAWGTVYGFIVAPFSSAVSWIKGAFSGFLGWLGGIPAAVGRALAGVFNAIISPFQSAWSWVETHILNPMKGAWNDVANTINAVHISTPEVKVAGHTLIPGFDWRPPFHIPTLASGGVFNRATLAVVGEAGREVVAPEAMLRSIMGERSAEVTINVYVPPTANPAETGRAVADALRSFFRAGGRLAVPA